MKKKMIEFYSDENFEKLIVNGEEHSAHVMRYDKFDYLSLQGLAYREYTRRMILQNYIENQPENNQGIDVTMFGFHGRWYVGKLRNGFFHVVYSGRGKKEQYTKIAQKLSEKH